jgi:hypothetical protein
VVTDIKTDQVLRFYSLMRGGRGRLIEPVEQPFRQTRTFERWRMQILDDHDQPIGEPVERWIEIPIKET